MLQGCINPRQSVLTMGTRTVSRLWAVYKVFFWPFKVKPKYPLQPEKYKELMVPTAEVHTV